MSEDDGFEESSSTSSSTFDETDFRGATSTGDTLSTLETELSTNPDEPGAEYIPKIPRKKFIPLTTVVVTCLMVLLVASFHGRLSLSFTKPSKPELKEKQHFEDGGESVLTPQVERFTLESMLKEITPTDGTSMTNESTSSLPGGRGFSMSEGPMFQLKSQKTRKPEPLPQEYFQYKEGAASVGPNLNLGSFDPPAFEGLTAEESNKKQWEMDVSRARQLASLDRNWKPVPLMKTLKNEQDEAAKVELADIVQSQRKNAKRKYSAEQQAKIGMALEVLKKFGGKSSKDTIVINNFKACLDTEDSTPNVELQIKGILGVGSMAVVFEVEPTDEKLKKRFGGKSMAMKVAIQSIEADAEREEIDETVDFLLYSVAQEEMVLGEIRKFAENPINTVERSGIVTPTFRADLKGEGKTGLIEGAAFHRTLLFTPVMASDFLTVIRQRGEEGVSLDVKLRTLKRLLLALGHAHASGVLNNDVKLDNVLINEQGEAYLVDFGGAARVGEVREVWSKANAAPEQIREIQDGSPMMSTEKGEAWGAGMTAFMALTGKAPFEWEGTSKSYSKLLFAEAPEVLDPDFNVKQFPSPALPLRRLGVSEEWICVITSLLQPDPQDRPTVRQILQAFPHLFQ